jgi:uncharacterized protein (TIGR02453 family)
LKKPSQGGGPAYYFHIDENATLLIAAGEYMPPSDRLRAIRQHVVDDSAGFGKTLKNKKLRETFGDLLEEGKLTRPPKGFDSDSPHIEYLKLKSFIVGKESSLKAAIPQNLRTHLAGEFKSAFPLVTWLREAR